MLFELLSSAEGADEETGMERSLRDEAALRHLAADGDLQRLLDTKV